MIITVETVDHRTIKIEIDGSESVKKLKERIEDKFGEKEYPASEQKLIYEGKILNDENEINEYHIDEEKFVVIMVTKPQQVSNESTSSESTTQPVATITSTTGASSSFPNSAAKQPEAKSDDKPANDKQKATETSSDADVNKHLNRLKLRKLAIEMFCRRFIEYATSFHERQNNKINLRGVRDWCNRSGVCGLELERIYIRVAGQGYLTIRINELLSILEEMAHDERVLYRTLMKLSITKPLVCHNLNSREEQLVSTAKQEKDIIKLFANVPDEDFHFLKNMCLHGKEVLVIKRVFARQIFDSRGNPTVEVDLISEKGIFRASVPSGASTGVHEAFETRDGDENNYHGQSVLTAVSNVNNIIAPELMTKNFCPSQQNEVDKFLIELDGTKNKSKLGGNAILAVSIAFAKAGAEEKGVPLYQHLAELAGNEEVILPVPAFNVIYGGSHAGNKLAMQEFMILPTGASSFTEAMKMGTEVYHHLKNVIKKKFGLAGTGVGDEGGFAPDIQENKEALELIQEAIKIAGYTGKIEIGMDVAASKFFKDGKYDLDFKNPKSDPSKFITPDQLAQLYLDWIKEYPIISIEDPFDQDDWESWTKYCAQVQNQVVGDDLTVTNPKRIETAVTKKACNCLLLKVNQIGSVTEAIKAHNLAKASGWGTMVSHRSGETEDAFIGDLVVGLSTGQIKTGAPCRSERLAKYNQILRIEEELGSKAKYAGKNFRHPV